MRIALKWHKSLVNYFRITFLSASSGKNVQILFCGHKQGSFIWNTNLLPLNFPSFCNCLLQIWGPYLLRVYFVQHWPFHSRKLHTQLFAEIAGLHMLIVHGAIWHHSGTGLSASRQNHSCSFTYYPWCWTPGSIPEHSSGCNATVSTIQVRFLFTPKLFPSCSQRGSGYPGSWFCVRVSPIWIPSNVASGA